MRRDNLRIKLTSWKIFTANTKIQTSDEAKSVMSQTIASLVLQEQRDGKGAA